MATNTDACASSSGTTPGPNTKKRGRSRGLKTSSMPVGQRIKVEINDQGQGIGKEASQLLTWMGTIVTKPEVLPCNFSDWRKVPIHYKEDAWDKVQEKFDIHADSRRWAFQKMGLQWKNFKSKLKADIYDRCPSHEECIRNCDDRVPKDQWVDLVSIWDSEKNKALCARNKENRSHQKMSHTAGRRSYAQLKEIKRKENPEGQTLSKLELFLLTHKKKTGEAVDEASKEVMMKLIEKLSQLPEHLRSNKAVQDDIYDQVMGIDTHGRVRMYGVGVSPKDLNKRPRSCAQALCEDTDLQAKVAAWEEEKKKNEEKHKKNEDAIATLQAQVATLELLLLGKHEGNSSSQGSSLGSDVVTICNIEL